MPAALQAHTSGIIGREEALFVQFTTAPAAAAEELLSLKPTIDGTVKLVGTSSLSFRPTTAWAAGTVYTATVQLPDGDEPYVFTFQTPQRKAEVISDGLVLPEDLSQGLNVEGRVVTNDNATTDEVKELLAATQAGNALDVLVEAGPDARHFTYTVLDPNRGKEPAPVVITYDGAKAGFADTEGEISVAIPADDDFRVESVTVQNLADGTLLARFTDRLDPKQDFKGLVSFNPGSGFTTKVSGNLLYIYPKSANLGNARVTLSNGIKNAQGFGLGRETNWNVSLGRTEPMLRSVGEGAILPHQGRRLFPFEAIGLTSVRLELVEIYPNNVQQYLQDYSLGDSPNDWSLRRVGKMIVQEKIDLSSLSTTVNTGRWARYALDLGQYIKDDASAIYQVRLGFGMGDAAVGCDVAPEDFGLVSLDAEPAADFTIGFQELSSRMGDYYGIHGYYDGYDWREGDDPCKPAYYSDERFLSRNVISSNLGLIAKRNPDRSTVVVATDLINAAPREGATVRAYSYQQQEIFVGQTSSLGLVNMITEERPALITATIGNDVAYLKLEDTELPLGRFDIGGVGAQGGVKGAFYTERGVWRPGDSVFLHFVLEDREDRLPQNYPIEFVLTDAQGRVAERRTVTPAFASGQLYPLVFTTKADDPTGNWTATVKAGGRTYDCPLAIETVKPNRLSIDLEQPAGGLRPDALSATLVSKWLYGAPASDLKATVEVIYTDRLPDFGGWTDYRFFDPARRLRGNGPEPIFDGQLDASGRAIIQLRPTGDRMPGPLYAGVGTKVFEPGGNFSFDNQRIPFDPYSVYTGIRIPEDKWGYKRMALEGNTTIDLAAVNTEGKGVGGRQLSVGLYKVDWRYWWQDNNDNVARFNGSRHTEAIETYSVTTGSDGSAAVSVSVSNWGRYLLRACDAGGHCTGQYFYGGYRADTDDRESASLLKLSADSEEVTVGEQVKMSVPSSAGGSLLVSLETGAGTIEQFWVDAKAGETTISFEADERMVPTVYANVTMLQPYEQTTNDRPIRLYGLLPVSVTDPSTILVPELDVADEWSPEAEVTVGVEESSGKPMTYTLAVVDEGLLGLTRFQTPDLHDRFFAKEALSVRSHDLYRYVIGSLNGEYGKVLAIGGGDGGEEEDDNLTANRFEPVVRHLGPFKLPAGKTGRHKVKLPNYVGAVRVMVVASGDRAYGSVGKRIPVVQPLMVLPTLPRVLGPGERVDMPVNVFAMNDKVKDVRVNVAESEGLVQVNEASKALSFSAPGNQLAYFPLTVGQQAGIAKFSVTGTGSGENTSQEVEIDVRNPNSFVSRSTTVALAPGETKTIPYERFGVPGTREAELELSSLPAMQLSRHLRYLLRYPYGCVEQTISPAFAQLYLDRVTELTAKQESDRQTNVTAGLKALRNFQTSTGGMAYWPGNRNPHPWASNYALHFLVEAERAGYGAPLDLKQQLIKFQKSAARNWRDNDRNFYASSSQLQRDQAYRLYVLALAGEAAIGPMNRLKGKTDLPASARCQLAAAYALVGQASAAKQLMATADTNVKSYRELGYTFGSDIRDMAMILEAQLATGEGAAAQQAFRLAERVGARRWLSTQEAAFAIVAIGKMSAGGNNTELKADFTSPSGSKTAVGANASIYRIELPTDAASSSFVLQNTGTATLYATVVTGGQPLPGEEQATSENLVLDVSYTDDEGNAIDVTNLASGTDFIANYTVRNPGSLAMNYRQLALRSLVPSGWEISNDRLDAGGAADEGGYNYRDFRDDRVFTFFHLNRGQTKTFSLRMTATYPGRYYLPAQLAEAMYADDVKAGVKGQWVEVGR
ncbi:MAG: MG2 domain-containing protein [Bacteroidota bacterium]